MILETDYQKKKMIYSDYVHINCIVINSKKLSHFFLVSFIVLLHSYLFIISNLISLHKRQLTLRK